MPYTGNRHNNNDCYMPMIYAYDICQSLQIPLQPNLVSKFAIIKWHWPGMEVPNFPDE